MTMREVQEIRPTHATRDGDGVAIQRVHGMQHAGMDPVLMIDELRSEHREDFAGGFPPHPHRGMQTLTYMKHGGIVHQDSTGNRGEIRSGGAQWMSAGRGIIHSEMPTLDSEGLHGFQLWINLARADKMSAPRYRDIPAQELGRQRSDKFDVTVIAGAWELDGHAVVGPLHELANRASVADLVLGANHGVTVSAGQEENFLAYVYQGSLLAGAIEVGAGNLLISGAGSRWQLEAGSNGASVLLLRGEPLLEPVAQHGPFVMNTPEEIQQAIVDYQSGEFLSAHAQDHRSRGVQAHG